MRKLYRTVRASLVFSILLLSFSFKAQSQRKQLTPATKVVNIAYVDQIALRKQYKAPNDTKKQFTGYTF
jgi:hypothetical protein